MPPGTDPKRLLLAAQDFAMDEFALIHRYAMVLHTDEPHPHVHLVVKAMSEQGQRLRIDKAKLRSWRSVCEAIAGARDRSECDRAGGAGRDETAEARWGVSGDGAGSLDTLAAAGW